MLRHLVGSVLNLENYFEDLKIPLADHYLMLYLTGNLFVAVHQESKINIIKYIKINYLNIIYFNMLKCWGQGVGQVLVKYRSGIGRLLVDFKFFENFFRSCEEFFLFFRKQNKTLKRGQTLERVRVLTFTFEVWGFRSFDENSGTFPSRVVLLVLPGTSKTQNQHISTLKNCSKNAQNLSRKSL